MKEDEFSYEIIEDNSDKNQPNKPDKKTILKHLLLFIVTFISVSVMGSLFVGRTVGVEELRDFIGVVATDGALFAFLLLGFLGTHEFGHYFAAVYHRVRVSLPYFIPLPFLSPIGTIGAVIRIKERIDETKKLFDIGIAGPLAGFVVSVIILLYGFATLPGPEYLQQFEGHDNINAYIAEHGTFPDEIIAEEGGEVLMMGNTLLYGFIASFFENAPPLWEMYHYPFLFAGWLGLFFTALNLMPVGQLDGGHILYGLIGYRRHRTFARLFFALVIMLCGVGAIPLLHQLLGAYDNNFGTLTWSVWAFLSYFMLRKAYYANQKWTTLSWVATMFGTAFIIYFLIDISTSSGYTIWIFWALFILFFVKIEHPPVIFEEPLDQKRRLLGWLCMIIFILCISPNPIYFLTL